MRNKIIIVIIALTLVIVAAVGVVILVANDKPADCEHSYAAEVVDATCTADGYTKHKCSLCGDEYTDTVVKALGHDYADSVTAPTCTEDGYTKHTCTRCGNEYTDTTVPALGHDFVAGTVVAPTYSDDGYTVYTCSRCGATEKRDIVAKLTEPDDECEHEYTDEVVPATCEQAGYTKHTCSKCGGTYTDADVPALGHDYIDTLTQPTCTEAGYTIHKCSRCEHEYKEEGAPANGHSFIIPKVVEPTYTEGGYTEYICDICGATKTGNETEPLEKPDDTCKHDYITATVPATCEHGGYTEHVCRKCGGSYLDNQVAALGHTYVETKVEATCTEGGYTQRKCALCGKTVKSNETDALGHSYKETVKDATCTEAGCVTHTCTRCGNSYEDKTQALGHNYKTTVTKPTCTKKGYTTHTCTRCGNSYKDTETAALGHDYKCVHNEETCTKAESYKHTCSKCGSSYIESGVPATGHKKGTLVKTVNNGCNSESYNVYKCSVCGVEFKTDYQTAGHKWVVTKSEYIPGEGCRIICEHRTCSVCGATMTENVETGRTCPPVEEWILYRTDEPTYTTPGYRRYKCPICGDFTSVIYAPKLESDHVHNWVFDSVVYEGSDTSDRVEKWLCKGNGMCISENKGVHYRSCDDKGNFLFAKILEDGRFIKDQKLGKTTYEVLDDRTNLGYEYRPAVRGDENKATVYWKGTDGKQYSYVWDASMPRMTVATLHIRADNTVYFTYLEQAG